MKLPINDKIMERKKVKTSPWRGKVQKNALNTFSIERSERENKAEEKAEEKLLKEAEATKKAKLRRKRVINENLVISHYTIEKIFRKGNPDAVSLYMFYIKTGNLQKTTSPRANQIFTMTGTSLGRDRVRKANKALKELKLINIKQEKTSPTSFGPCFVNLLGYCFPENMR